MNGWGIFSAGDGWGAYGDHDLMGWPLISNRPRHRLQTPLSGLRRLTVSPDGTKLALVATETVYVWDVAGMFEPERHELAEEELSRLWAGLGRTEADTALRDMVCLAGSPRQAVPFLHQRLRTFLPKGADQLSRLIADLDDDDFAVREKATEQLYQLGIASTLALRRDGEDPHSPESRRRIERLVKNQQRIEETPSYLQLVRAISVLERLGTERAREALSELTQAAPDTFVGREAKGASKRLAQRPVRR